MTRGQEGFVHGWQSKQGSNGQTVLDTLFVKLKNPPTCVNVPGLPENVVPVYPTTTNISAMLPNDEKFYITCTCPGQFCYDRLWVAREIKAL